MTNIHAPSLAAASLGAVVLLTACGRSGDASGEARRTVVLYTSADSAFAREVVGAFEAETGVRVELVGDTEATKTTGLVMRLQAEKDAPQADVWWSSEPMGSILLGDTGVLEAGAIDDITPEGWPSELIGTDGTWLGFAERARVIAYSTDRVEKPPTTLAALTEPEWSGRVGIAVPQFGTTRGHMALLADRWGDEAFNEWLEAIQANDVRLYDGNARVVRAIYEGEIDLALTDTDDVWVAIDNGWPVGMVYESAASHDRWPSIGATTIPNTVGVVAGCPHPEEARLLAAYLASPAVERLLAESGSRNIPVDPQTRASFSDLVPPSGEERPDYAQAADDITDAMDACERVLMSP